MPLPITFGGLAGPIPTSNLDLDFAAVAAMGIIYTLAVGTNALALTPAGSQSVPTAYANGFRAQFVAVNSNTGATTANVSSLGTLPVFKDTTLGPVVCTGGEIIVKNAYQIWYDAALNGGTGGFHLTAAGGAGAAGGSSGGGAWTFISQQTAAATASVQFLAGVSSTYTMYELDFDNALASSSGALFQVQVSTNAGSSWIATGYTWTAQLVANGQTLTSSGGTNDTGFKFGTLSSGAPTSGVMRLYGTQNASGSTQMEGQLGLNAANGSFYVFSLAGTIANSAAINAVQVIPTTGNITSGTITLYGLANTNSSGGGSGGGGVTTAGVVADARNFVAARATNTTLTMTTTEVIAKLAPGSSAFLGVNLSLTLNFATTGLNALDTGTVAASTFYGFYFIYNPTTNVWGCIASLNTTKPTTLPAGFTAFALMGVLRTDASAHIVAGFNQFGRTAAFNPISIFTGHAQSSSMLSQSVAAAVPPIAKTITGLIGTTSTSSSQIWVSVAADANFTDFRASAGAYLGSNTAYPGSLAVAASFEDVQMTSPQTIYWASLNQNNLAMYVTGYTI
jgi:hypothetical protein